MKKIVMLTAYDYPTAKIIDETGIDFILVGDSLSMVILGQKDTKSTTMNEMIHHTRAVARGVSKAIIVVDMPINSYNNPKEALQNANLLCHAGAQLVKIEGFKPDIVDKLVKNKIKVIGHLGLQPQTAPKYSVQGTDKIQANTILQNAKGLEKAGISLLVLECIPQDLAKRITESLSIPTIGIGAGKYCSGQVLVLHDILGLSEFQGKMVKQYINLETYIRKAVSEFKYDVLTGNFPDENHTFK